MPTHAGNINDTSRFVDGGSVFKIASVYPSIPTNAHRGMMDATCVAFRFDTLGGKVRVSGGVYSTIVERLFSAMRVLGLKHGYIPDRTKYPTILSKFLISDG